MTKKTMVICFLAMLICINPHGISLALAAGQNTTTLDEGNYAADIFAGEMLQIEEIQAEQRNVPVGPAMLVLGIILLAAAGRQYSKQYGYANSQLHEISAGLESLVDESVRIESGQYEVLHEKLESLQESQRQLVKELQQIEGE